MTNAARLAKALSKCGFTFVSDLRQLRPGNYCRRFVVGEDDGVTECLEVYTEDCDGNKCPVEFCFDDNGAYVRHAVCL